MNISEWANAAIGDATEEKKPDLSWEQNSSVTSK